MSQAILAEKVGVEPATISRWENSLNWPGPKEVEKLAEIYGVPVSFLFDGSDISPPNRDQVITRSELLDLIASGKVPSGLIPKPSKPTPEEALSVLAEMVATFNELNEGPAKKTDPKLAKLLSAIESHPTILDIALDVAKGFAAATKQDKARPRDVG